MSYKRNKNVEREALQEPNKEVPVTTYEYDFSKDREALQEALGAVRATEVTEDTSQASLNAAQEFEQQENIRRELGLENIEFTLRPDQEAVLTDLTKNLMEGERKFDEEDGKESKAESDPEKNKEEKEVRNFAKELLDELLSGKLKKKVERFSNKELTPKQTELLESIDSAAPLIKEILEKGGVNEKLDESEQVERLNELTGKIIEVLPEEYKEQLLEQIKQSGKDPGKWKRLGSSGLDFFPVLGSAKMLMEAAKGKTLVGEDLEGWRRKLHAVEGGTFLLLDMAQVGWLGKMTEKTGSKVAIRAFRKAGAIGRASGLSKEVYQPIFRTGKLIAENPFLAKLIDKTFDEAIRYRKLRVAAEFSSSKESSKKEAA